MSGRDAAVSQHGLLGGAPQSKEEKEQKMQRRGAQIGGAPYRQQRHTRLQHKILQSSCDEGSGESDTLRDREKCAQVSRAYAVLLHEECRRPLG